MTYGTSFVTRAGWGARAWVCRPTNIDPEGITIHYGGPSPWGSGVDRSSAARFQASADHRRCASILRAYQAYHLDTRGWCDLAYNAAVCPHGVRYEGRGPGVRSGAQGTNEGNRRSYAVVGLWGSGDPLTVAAKRAFYDEASRFGFPLKWGHRDWKSTSCPGDPAYGWRQAGFPRPDGGAPPPPPPPPILPPRPVGSYRMPPIVRQGSTGGTVRKLQGLLLAHGYNLGSTGRCGVDGVFGPATRGVVQQFQRSRRITADGIVGPNTWRYLIET
jgi:hypothetical protein